MKTFAVCALGVACSLGYVAADTKIKVEQLPPAVRSAMQEQTKGATVLGASKERENGRMTYEVETRRDGKGRDLTFAADGSLLEVEQEVDLESVPGPAKEALRKRAAGEKIEKVESVTQGSTVSYEAEVRAMSGKSREVAVNADGSARKED